MAHGIMILECQGVPRWCGLYWGVTMETPTSKGAGVKAGLSRMARVSQEWPWVSRWGGVSVEASPRVSRGGEASDGASPCESWDQSRGVPGCWG